MTRGLALLWVGVVPCLLLSACGQDFAAWPDRRDGGGVLETARYSVTREVPGEYASIGEAVRSARNGDVVSIAAGEHLAPRVFVGHAITIRGAGAGRTIVRGNFEMDDTSGVVISDLTLQGDGGGAGVEGWGRYTVERCEVRGYRTGLDASSSAGVTVRDCRIASRLKAPSRATGRHRHRTALFNGKAGSD